MRLQSLQIQGFKSFAEKTRIELAPRINCIVGPNGCGKSNIVDAIKWVLGEQSARSLRGNNMEDVIFNGSALRGSVGMAAVGLTLEGEGKDEEGRPLRTKVGRKLYRSGQSNYLLDGKNCRLKDIHESFMDTGVGSQAYAILEQGRVDEIIRARPLERREVIEEAAGVMRYKLKRQQTEKKLDATHENLLRINDIYVEVAQQRDRLEKQAAKAQQWLELDEQLREREVALRCQEHREHLQALENLKAAMAGCAQEVAKEEAALAASEAAQEATQDALAQAKDLEAKLRQAHGETKVKLDGLRKEAKNAQRRLAEDEETQRRLNQEITILEAQLANSKGEQESLATDVEDAQERAESLAAKLAELEAAYEEKRAHFNDQEKALDEARKEALGVLQNLSSARNEVTRLETQRQGFDAQKMRLHKESAEAALRVEKFETKLQEAARKLHDRQGRLATMRKEQQELQQAIKDQKAALRQIEQEHQERKHEATRLRSRLETLKELRLQRHEFDGASKQVLEEGSSGETFTAVGLLADAIQADEAYFQAIDAALEDHFQSVLFPDFDEALKASAYLRSQEAGRVTLLPTPLRAPSNGLDPLLELPGVLGRLSDLVEFDADREADLDALLHEHVLTETLDQALAAWQQTESRAVFVTLAGDVLYPNGSIRSGQGKHVAKDYLARRKEIEELEQQLANAEEDIANLSDDEARERKALHRLLGKERELGEQVTNLNVAINQQKRDAESLQGDIKRTNTVLSTLDFERRQLAESQEQNQEQADALSATVSSLEAKQSDLNRRTEQLSQALAGGKEATEDLSRRLSQANVDASTARERLRSQRVALETSQRTQEERNTRLASDHKALEQLAGRMKENKASLGANDDLLDHLDSERERLEGNLARATAAVEEAQRNHKAQQQAVAAQRKEVEAAHRRQQTAELQVTSKETAISQFLDEFRATYEIDMEQLPAKYKEAPEHPEALRLEVADLKRKKTRLGSVNLEAIAEYKEVQERYEHYKEQLEDLQGSMEQLKGAIKRLNGICRERFKETFDVVNKNFQEVFTLLFNGGEARMELVGSDDVLEAGIEIAVQPPGKRTQRLTLLSGGEKTMVTLALLVAIFLHKPSPFCIMDEVDAALDDANIQRYTKLLKDLATKTQLLVITHNQHTMSDADTLYGVTMEEGGVSKLVSVDLRQRVTAA